MTMKLETVLKDTLSGVNEWLRFAEAKNGVLVGVSIAVAFGVNDEQVRNGVLSGVPQLVSDLSTLLSIAATFMALGSFVPRLTLLLRPRSRGGNANIVYFGHIASFDDVSYLKAVQEELQLDETSCLARTYSHQIVTNSQIAVGKYQLFGVGFWFLLAGVTLPVAGRVVLAVKELI